MSLTKMSNETLPPSRHPLVRLLPPCDHNAWNNTRMRGKVASLSCRMCPAQWKAGNLMEIVCPEFRETGRCPLSVSCPYLHIYRHKRQDLSPTNPTDASGKVDPVLRRAALEVITSRQASGRVWPSDYLHEIQRKIAQVSESAHRIAASVAPRGLSNQAGERDTTPSDGGVPQDCICDENSSSGSTGATDSFPSGTVSPQPFDSASQSLLSSPSSSIAGPMPVLPHDSLLSGPSIDLMSVTGRYVPQQRIIRQRQQQDCSAAISSHPVGSSSVPSSSVSSQSSL